MSHGPGNIIVYLYLLEEYALGRLQGESLARVEELLKSQPQLRRHVTELQKEATLLTSALASSASDPAQQVDDSKLASLLGGTLEEAERAALESSLAGDLRSQSRLAALYRETNAVLYDDTAPETTETHKPVLLQRPELSHSDTQVPPIEANALLASGAFAVISLLAPAPISTATLFLSLGAFGWWTVGRASAGNLRPTPRMRSYWGLAPAAIIFVAGVFTGPYGLWCYVCGAGWYWYWLVQRWSPVPVRTEVEPVKEAREKARAREIWG